MRGSHRMVVEREGRTLTWEADLLFRSDLENFYYTYTRRLLESGMLLARSPGTTRYRETISSRSSKDLERAFSSGSETKDGEVSIEGQHPKDAEPLHHRERRTVDDREILIRKNVRDRPSGFEVRGRDGLDFRDTRAKASPETLGSLSMEPMPEKQPRFYQYVIGGDERLWPFQELLRSTVVSIAGVRGRVPNGGVDEETQREPRRVRRVRIEATASPIMRSLSRAMSLPFDFPRSKIADTPTFGSGAPRSRAIRFRTYWASDTPSSAARFRARFWISESREICVLAIMMATS